jgi:hypothetical protein
MPTESEPRILTQAEADEYKRKLALISDAAVRAEYSAFWRACELRPDCVPRPGLIQRMLIAWKALWKQEELHRTLERLSKKRTEPAPTMDESPP